MITSYRYEAKNGDEVLVTFYEGADEIPGLPNPEVAIRPKDARSWGPPLYLLDVATHGHGATREA